MSHVRHPALHAKPFAPMPAAEAATFDPLIASALAEDVGSGDVTTDSTIDADAIARAAIVARRSGTIAGLAIAARVFHQVDPRISIEFVSADGATVEAGTPLLRIDGPARGILTGERVALNFLGRLSGIATLTKRFVDAAGSGGARIADTRKTTPGLRALERYAVRAGGGVNHRFGLADAVLIKDNHLEASGSVSRAVARARAAAPDKIVEVECDSVQQVREALAAGADSVLLDNMDDAQMKEAVALAHGKAVLEASGSMTLDRVREIAGLGVEVISVGALTHSAPTLDVALDFEPAPAKR
jgi:nicotinate-nucleotide pyrophosphorylase (carboxylating)